MTATIEQIEQHYYVLRMGDREVGGTNRQALERFARKNGYSEITFIPKKKELRAEVWRPNMNPPVRIPEKVLAWRERRRKGSIMRPSTFKRITKEARKRYRKKKAGPAAGGKAYWVTLLRKYLRTHPGDPAATKALRALVKRRYTIPRKRKTYPPWKPWSPPGMGKNPRLKWYVGVAKDTGASYRFQSPIIPTRRTHGRLYKFVTGPFKNKDAALAYQRSMS